MTIYPIKDAEETSILQKMIDESSEIVFSKGEYLISPLFFHSDMKIVFEKGAVLRLTDEEKRFSKIPTRIAGIEMEGYPAMLNFISCENVTISGEGLLLGQGEKWYIKYWGKDMKSGMRKTYDEQHLRWACDYDCFRPKMILVQESENVTLCDLELHDSPFWNVHILYSKNIKVCNLRILSENPISPSTDGIDVDSSEDVCISSCHISTNDDAISIKSGRDLDGLRVNRPCKNVVIEDCFFHYGYGLSIGSELSGGIDDIIGRNLVFDHSDCGFRIKSSKSRKGYVKHVHLSHITMKEVRYPFYCYLDWNPLYNRNELPKDYKGEIPFYWHKLLSLPDDSLKDTAVDDLSFSDVSLSSNEVSSCLFTFCGFPSSKITNVKFENLFGEVSEWGTFENTEEPIQKNIDVKILGNLKTVPGEFDNR